MNFVSLNEKRLFEGFEKVAGNLLNRGSAFDSCEDDGELLAAGAGEDVHGANAGAEDGGDALDAFIADAKAVGVVDAFEAIEIEREDGQLLVGLDGMLDDLGEQVREKDSVGQAGEMVVPGLEVDLVLKGFAFRDIEAKNKARRLAVKCDPARGNIHAKDASVFADMQRCATGRRLDSGDPLSRIVAEGGYEYIQQP